MHVPIPRWLVRAWDDFVVWGNVPVSRRFVRLDILLAIGGLVTAIYYGWLNGWQGALVGILVYMGFLTLALVLRR